jgi:hypothetical protein
MKKYKKIKCKILKWKKINKLGDIKIIYRWWIIITLSFLMIKMKIMKKKGLYKYKNNIIKTLIFLNQVRMMSIINKIKSVLRE